MRQSVIQGCVTTEIAPGFHLHDLNALLSGQNKIKFVFAFLSQNILSIFLRSIMQLFSDGAVFLWETMYQILYESYRLQFVVFSPADCAD